MCVFLWFLFQQINRIMHVEVANVMTMINGTITAMGIMTADSPRLGVASMVD